MLTRKVNRYAKKRRPRRGPKAKLIPSGDVHRRIGPCKCGCGGKAPGHAALYHRKLKDIREVPGVARWLYEPEITLQFDAIATAAMPGGVIQMVCREVNPERPQATFKRWVVVDPDSVDYMLEEA